jgi:hypothetical protein
MLSSVAETLAAARSAQSHRLSTPAKTNPRADIQELYLK